MKLFLALSLMFTTIHSYAAHGYRIKMNVLLNGQLISTPHIWVKKGQKGKMSTENPDAGIKSELEITANEGTVASKIHGNSGILLNLELENTLWDDRKIKIKTEILVSEGKIALFETMSDNDKLELEIMTTKIDMDDLEKSI